MNRDAFCSMNGARTFIDSNLVELHAVDAGNIARYLMGQEPEGIHPALLTDVLHEAVHHWCLDTRIGEAIAMARAELLESALADATGARMARCYARYRSAIEVMRPVVEGLACFAEFDVAPGAGNVRAVPLGWLAVIAQPQRALRPAQRDAGQAMDDLITQALAAMRTRESTARRKDDLLVQPLDPRRRGGYLTGYLLVKGLQARTASVTPLALDSELWLSFLQAFLFSDARTASQLLAPVDVEQGIGATFEAGQRFMDRLESLTDARSTAAALVAFDAALAAGASGTTDVTLGNGSDAVDRVERLWSVHQARLLSHSDEEVIRLIRLVTRAVLQNRDWICVASARGALTFKPGGRVVFTDESGMPRFAGPGDASIAGAGLTRSVSAGATMPAALEFWVGPASEGAVYALISDLGVHAHVKLWSADDAAVAEFVRTIRSNAHLVNLTDVLRGTADELIHEQAWAADLDADISTWLDGRLRAQADLAVRLFGGDGQARDLLWEDGFFAVFDSYDLLKAVAAHGLLASLGPDAPAREEVVLGNHVVTRAWLEGQEKGLTLATDDFDRLLI